MQTTFSTDNSGKQAPRWFRKFKKIFTNLETAAIVLLLANGYEADSLLMLYIKTGTSVLLENLETVLADKE
jgi:hypothetical protein